MSPKIKSNQIIIKNLKTLFFYIFNYDFTVPNWWQHCHLKLIVSLKLLVLMEINLAGVFFGRLGEESFESLFLWNH